MTGWRWWLFAGVAHETPRMRPSWWAYQRQLELLAARFAETTRAMGVALQPMLAAMARLARSMQPTVDAIVAIGRALSPDGMTPAERLAEAMGYEPLGTPRAVVDGRRFGMSVAEHRWPPPWWPFGVGE